MKQFNGTRRASPPRGKAEGVMKRPLTRWLVLIAGIYVAAMGACGPVTSSQQPAAEVNAALYTSGDYKIGAEDVVEVIVWRNADLTKVVPVRPDGKISLPLVGDVPALGLTAAQLTQDISARLKYYKETPNVSVVVQQVNSYSVYVMGEVAKPGRYQLKTYTTLLQAISTAGGFTPFAAKNRMFVLRKSSEKGADTRINVSFDDIVSGTDSSKNVMLFPGDTVVVP